MTAPRITKIICPCCEGGGRFPLLQGMRCLWCDGARRVPVSTAHSYANLTYNLAGGGFIAGDHEIDTKREMEKRAEAVYALTGIAPPWQQLSQRPAP